jgi:hypothetical protein
LFLCSKLHLAATFKSFTNDPFFHWCSALIILSWGLTPHP